MSYNEIENLDPLKNLVNLEVLYIGNNNIQKIDQLNYLSGLSLLKDAVFRGNPFAMEDNKDKNKAEYFPEVKKRIPTLLSIDGELVV